jgi:uncharacterized membrane protein
MNMGAQLDLFPAVKPLRVADVATLRVDAPFAHPVLGEIWITKRTPTHVSFYMQTSPRRFGRFKVTIEEFETGRLLTSDEIAERDACAAGVF